ncbi:CcmD family protein [Membranihabitans maritimus]|uniref:CcmD family protein n=1 Tax=Membranihabitans maritimus TaxID=2904244 RepID=UPI0034E22DA6
MFNNIIKQFSMVMASDFMHNMGKMYVVVAVIILILIGLFLYLYSLDKKIQKLEKKVKHGQGD